MTQLIKSLNWIHARKALHIFAHLLLATWIINLAMNTKEMNNNHLFFQYIAIMISAFILFRVNQSILKN